jgi:hypothetical protein
LINFYNYEQLTSYPKFLKYGTLPVNYTTADCLTKTMEKKSSATLTAFIPMPKPRI